MVERYTGPSARRIADLLPHRVSYERGWFWTTTAICHGGRSDGLAFRQRPDGEGIETRCHTGGCSPGVVITHLEDAIGLPIWTAFEPVADSVVKAPEKRPWWKRKQTVVAGVAALVVAAPLLTLDVELFFLNLVGLGIGRSDNTTHGDSPGLRDANLERDCLLHRGGGAVPLLHYRRKRHDDGNHDCDQPHDDT